jgi:hypothetical protein
MYYSASLDDLPATQRTTGSTTRPSNRTLERRRKSGETTNPLRLARTSFLIQSRKIHAQQDERPSDRQCRLPTGTACASASPTPTCNSDCSSVEKKLKRVKESEAPNARRPTAGLRPAFSSFRGAPSRMTPVPICVRLPNANGERLLFVPYLTSKRMGTAHDEPR